MSQNVAAVETKAKMTQESPAKRKFNPTHTTLAQIDRKLESHSQEERASILAFLNRKHIGLV